MTHARTIKLATLAAASLALVGCNNAGEGALSGAALGAGTGAIIGSFTGSAGAGAAIGAAAGALGGAVIGDQNERNARYHREGQHHSDRYYEDDYGYQSQNPGRY